jgi:hypothetical protein
MSSNFATIVKMAGKSTWLIAAGLLATAVAAAIWFRPDRAARVIAGLTAHNLCFAVFVDTPLLSYSVVQCRPITASLMTWRSLIPRFGALSASILSRAASANENRESATRVSIPASLVRIGADNRPVAGQWRS